MILQILPLFLHDVLVALMKSLHPFYLPGQPGEGLQCSGVLRPPPEESSTQAPPEPPLHGNTEGCFCWMLSGEHQGESQQPGNFGRVREKMPVWVQSMLCALSPHSISLWALPRGSAWSQQQPLTTRSVHATLAVMTSISQNKQFQK